MQKGLQLWHVGENADGEETVLRASPFGQGLQEFRLQPNESVLVRTADQSDLLVVTTRQTIDPAKVIDVLERMTRLINDLMPGVAHIALPDYALLNEAPIEAKQLIRQLRQG